MPENGNRQRSGKWRELLNEFRLVLGNGSLLDAILPPVIFLIINSIFGFQAAMWTALGLAVVIAGLRLGRG